MKAWESFERVKDDVVVVGLGTPLRCLAVVAILLPELGRVVYRDFRVLKGRASVPFALNIDHWIVIGEWKGENQLERE